MIDRTQAPNAANDGIAKSLTDEIGAGRGDWNTPASASFLIHRDPFRAIRRGREIFQRKFTRLENQGPAIQDGIGDIGTVIGIGAGLSDSCAGCHGRPRGSAGGGGDVVTRPDSRDAPHLFGLGLQEMLGDEITTALRQIRTTATTDARSGGAAVTRPLIAKGIEYGTIKVDPAGMVDTSGVVGVDPDLRVRPFFAQGGTISIREFLVGAFNAEMGLQAADDDLRIAAVMKGKVTTPGGMVLDGALDAIEAPPAMSATDDPDGDGVTNEIPVSIVDFMEFYLLNYFKPAVAEQTRESMLGRVLFEQIGCSDCHMPELTIDRDRRFADVETVFDPVRGNPFNRLHAQATPLTNSMVDVAGMPPIQTPKAGSFVVRNIFTDFKRHDLGVNFHENNYDMTQVTEMITEPLWGVASTAPYGHDGRSVSLTEVILRHGGEAQDARDKFEALSPTAQLWVREFLSTLILFPPDDTSSNLDEANPMAPGFPQAAHGSIRLVTVFNNPMDPE